MFLISLVPSRPDFSAASFICLFRSYLLSVPQSTRDMASGSAILLIVCRGHQGLGQDQWAHLQPLTSACCADCVSHFLLYEMMDGLASMPPYQPLGPPCTSSTFPSLFSQGCSSTAGPGDVCGPQTGDPESSLVSGSPLPSLLSGDLSSSYR